MSHLPLAVRAFRDLFESGASTFDPDLLVSEVVLRPPTYGKEWTGRDLVAALLGFAADALAGLKYTDVWQTDDRFVLRFEGKIDGQLISGVDVVSLSDQRLSLIEIFARPPKAVLALRDAMGVRVRSDAAVSTAMGLD